MSLAFLQFWSIFLLTLEFWFDLLLVYLFSPTFKNIAALSFRFHSSWQKFSDHLITSCPYTKVCCFCDFLKDPLYTLVFNSLTLMCLIFPYLSLFGVHSASWISTFIPIHKSGKWSDIIYSNIFFWPVYASFLLTLHVLDLLRLSHRSLSSVNSFWSVFHIV